MDVINIRESLLDIDRKTYCKYDLTTLYEACNLDDQNKKKLVQYIASYEHPSVIGKFLETNAGPMMEAVADDLTDAETTKVIDDINDGTERTLWNLLDQADEEDKKLSEDVNWRTAPSNSKEVSSYVYRKIKMHDDLTSDDSRYWDFDRCVREGDDAKLVKSAPKGAKYSFSLVNGDVDIDLYMGYGASEDGSDCWFVVDNNPDADAVIEMCEEAEPSYRDKSGILGIPGERYTMSQLDDIWEQGKDSDPSIMAYKGNRNAWFNDTLRHMDESVTINGEKLSYAVINPDGTYAGVPCATEEEARELAAQKEGRVVVKLGEQSLDEEWSEKDVEFNDRYFPRVDINDKSRYDYVQYKGKHFAYDKKHNILMYLFQDDEEVENMGPEAPWREMEGVGLSAEHWNDKEARQGYLDEWIFEMDAETSYMIQDFVQNELPYYQNQDGVVEESYRDIDTILDDLGGVDSVRSRIAAARKAYPGIDDDELADMLCDDDNSEDWVSAIEYLGEGFIGDLAKVGKAAVKEIGKKVAKTDFYQKGIKPGVDAWKEIGKEVKDRAASSDVVKAAKDAYDKTGTKRKVNSAKKVRDIKKQISNATTYEQMRDILSQIKLADSNRMQSQHTTAGKRSDFAGQYEAAYLKKLVMKRCKEMGIQVPKSISEAVEPAVLTCRLEVYDRYGGGGARKLRVRGADEHAALVSLLGKIRTYLQPEDAEEMSVDQILQSLEESNGDGCDYITELKNETTGEVLLAGDAEMDWEEYGIDEEISTKKTTARNESLLSEWFVGEPDPTGRLEGEARANMNKPQSWTDVYKQFLDVVESSEYDNIQDNVEALYRKHEGEPAWDEAWKRWSEGDDYIAEAVATAERPMSKMAGTLSSVLLAHKDEVETLFDVRSAIEFLDRIRPEVKNVGYVDKVKSDLMRKRGANPIQYFWNIILKGDGEGTDKGGASSTPRSKIKKWATESLKEEVNSNDDVTLEYWDLEGYSGCFELNIGWDEFVESVQDDVLTDMISDEEFEAHSPDGVIADQEWLDDYIRSNADEIFRKYEKKLLDQFRDIAQERADEEMADNPFDDDPRWEPEYWEESWNWKKGINEEVELDRKNFVSLVKDKEGYFVLLDGTYQRRIAADTDEEAIEKFRSSLEEAVDASDDGTPYTHTQVFDELKLETRNFTIDGDTIQYYHQSEANAAVRILKKHYTTVEGPTETTDEWFRIEFSGKKGSKKTESVNPAELTDCPECGDTSFDCKNGKCKKCSYREELQQSKSIKESAEQDSYIESEVRRITKDFTEPVGGITFDAKEDADVAEAILAAHYERVVNKYHEKEGNYFVTFDDGTVTLPPEAREGQPTPFIQKITYPDGRVKEIPRTYEWALYTMKEAESGNIDSVTNFQKVNGTDYSFDRGLRGEVLHYEIFLADNNSDSSMLGEAFDDDFSDEELANIYGGDTKNDIPDGLETPQETEARLNESAEPMIYLFPELSEDDRVGLLHYNLRYLGKNHGPDGSENNSVVLGTEADLRAYAEKDLGYELHPDYLYYEDDFAGDIVKEDLQ